MSKRSLFCVWLAMPALCLGGCAAIQKDPTRTVLMTFDAASDSYIDTLQSNGQLESSGFFARVKRQGYTAAQLTPINVANTGPTHAAIFSGATPAVSGFVGQTFATPTDELPKAADAFTYIGDAETIVSSSRRQGKRTACFAAPGLDGRSENYDCDYMLSFAQSAQESMSIKFSPVFLEGVACCPMTAGGGNPLLAVSGQPNLPPEISNNQVQLRVIDRNAADSLTFDTVYIQLPDNSLHIIEPGKIFPFERIENGIPVMNALWLNRFDRETGEVDLYWGQPYKTIANPGMMEAVIKVLGPWPGTLDARALHAGRLTEAGFDALNEYQARYAFDAMELLLARNDWDLFVGYVSYLDTVQHEYLVTSPRQLDHETKAKIYAAKIKDAYLKVDRWMGKAARSGHSKNTNFLAASDHGMIASHTVLAISSLIESWGYAVGGNRPDIGIYNSGAAAHLYVNGDDRPGGHIDQKRKLEIIADLKTRLRNFEDERGENIFPVVQSKETLSALDLQHPGNAGDLFVSAAAGFGLDPRKSPSDRFFFPSSYNRDALIAAGLTPAEVDYVVRGFFNQGSPGVHGHVASTPDIAAIFYGLGPDIPKRNGPTAHVLQIAPTLACLLNIAPPLTAQETAIDGFCKAPK